MAETKCVDVSVVGSYFESMSDPRHLRNRKHLLVLRRLIPEETMVRVSTTCTEVSRGQNPGLKTPPFLAA